MEAIDVPIGKRFRWRATRLSPWETYTAIRSPPGKEDEVWARCAHGHEDKFNPYAKVELVDD